MNWKPVLIGGLLSVVVIATLLIVILRSLDKTRATFIKRHSEATALIERVYDYYCENGEWPPGNDIDEWIATSSTSEWAYSADSGLGAPVLALHGPYHMALIYHFNRIDQGRISRKWILSIEGDKMSFLSDSPYNAPNCE